VLRQEALLWQTDRAMHLRDALVSRNCATTKHPIWKLEYGANRLALFAWSYV